MDFADKMPEHIAIIMDGNRRWAKKRNLPIITGHRAGADTLEKIINHCMKLHVRILTVYAFSTENWKRPSEQVQDLMNLIKEYLQKLEKDNNDRNVCIKVIGDITRLDEDLQNQIINLENRTKNNNGFLFNIALNYGGRDEIIYAIKSLSADELENLTQETFEKKLYTAGAPDPDLIIRTAGEQRLSNFLLWQSAYSEFWSTDVLWPDFDEKDLEDAIKDFNIRERKFGGK